MDEHTIAVADWMGSRRLWRRIWGPFAVLAVLAGLLVDFRDATSRVTDMIPQALALFAALVPVLVLGGIAFALVWLAGTILDMVAEKRMANRQASRIVVERGYEKLRAACEPETMDADHGMARLRADARDHVNQVIPLLRGDHPGMCTTDDASLQAWYDIFARLRMEPGLARLAAQEAAKARERQP